MATEALDHIYRDGELSAHRLFARAFVAQVRRLYGRSTDTRHRAQPSTLSTCRRRREKRSEQPEGGTAARTWHAREVRCPKCQAPPGTRCKPNGPHRERVEWAAEFTRKLWG
ncbi:zinc finger domain-containing protein [Streptomyces globisporus]